MPTVAIIGRPNTGKSTLFNAVLGERRAIESPVPGTTRDRVFGIVKGEKLSFLLVDTGGLTLDIPGELEENMKAQALESISAADCIWFCIDVRSEMTREEEEIAHLLRRHKPRHVPLFLVGTKSEKPNASLFLGEMTRLGLGDAFFFVSAQEGYALDELRLATEEALINNGFSAEEQKNTSVVSRIALLGRPNAGKSTLLNALSGRSVALVSPIAGTTRDQIDSPIDFEKESYLFIDTAGIRRKSVQNTHNIERYSRLRSLSALQRTDIAILLIDATVGISHSDQTIAGEFVDNGVGAMIVFSKWDLVNNRIREEVQQEQAEKEKRTGIPPSEQDREREISERSASARNRLLRSAQKKFPFLPWAPVLFLSAAHKKGLPILFQNVKRIMEERKKRISTNALNGFLEEVLGERPPVGRGTKVFRIKYGTQIGENPPSFLFFANDPDAAHFSFRRFLENRLRETYGFWGTPIRIEIRKKTGYNPFIKPSE